MNFSNLKDYRKVRRTVYLLILAIILFPYEAEIVPAWRIRVVDEAGQPLKDLAVSQNWRIPHLNLGIPYLDLLWLEEDFRTDEEGYVNFPQRTTWENMLARGCLTVWEKVLGWKTGADADVFGWHNYLGGIVYYRRGDILPQVLVMRPSKYV